MDPSKQLVQVPKKIFSFVLTLELKTSTLFIGNINTKGCLKIMKHLLRRDYPPVTFFKVLSRIWMYEFPGIFFFHEKYTLWLWKKSIVNSWGFGAEYPETRFLRKNPVKNVKKFPKMTMFQNQWFKVWRY